MDSGSETDTLSQSGCCAEIVSWCRRRTRCAHAAARSRAAAGPTTRGAGEKACAKAPIIQPSITNRPAEMRPAISSANSVRVRSRTEPRQHCYFALQGTWWSLGYMRRASSTARDAAHAVTGCRRAGRLAPSFHFTALRVCARACHVLNVWCGGCAALMRRASGSRTRHGFRLVCASHPLPPLRSWRSPGRARRPRVCAGGRGRARGMVVVM